MYGARYEVYRELYPALSTAMHALASPTERAADA
jgi:hypothetical protein